MSAWHDLIDWVGGWPFEAASPDDVFRFYRDRGFLIEELKVVRGYGCNEYLFVRRDDNPLRPPEGTRRMTIVLERTIPILRIFDVAKAKEFYVEFLGFQVEWEHRFDENAPLYLQIVRGGLTFHLSEHHGDACPSNEFVWMTGIEAFHAELAAKNYKYLRPGLEMTFYGTREASRDDRSFREPHPVQRADRAGEVEQRQNAGIVVAHDLAQLRERAP